MNTKSIENLISRNELVHKDELENSTLLIDLCDPVVPRNNTFNTFCNFLRLQKCYGSVRSN